MGGAEHQALVESALRLMWEHGCAAAACEVPCPISRYRVDVAAYFDRLPQGSRRSASRAHAFETNAGAAPARSRDGARTMIIECKASRADLWRDGDRPGPLLARRRVLHAELQRVREEFVKPLEPHLRQQSGWLFADHAAWDFHHSRLHSHRLLMIELHRLDERIHANTKFFTLAQYRLAHWLVLATPRGLIDPEETPPGWGLLEIEGTGSRMSVAPPEHESGERRVARLLRNIAATASRRAFGGVSKASQLAEVHGETAPEMTLVEAPQSPRQGPGS